MDTKSLVQYLSKAGLFKKAVQYKETHFSAKTVAMFTQLLEQIGEAKEAYKVAKPEVLKSRQEINVKDFPRSGDFDYFPKPICDTIRGMRKHGCKYTFTVGHHTYEIAMMCPHDKVNPTEFFQKAISRIYEWLHVLNRHASSECSQKMNIYLYFTELKKEIPKGGSTPISQVNVNTAFTTFCQKVTELNLSREEEWMKVFMHENFHNTGLDFSQLDTTKSNQHILTYFPVNSDVRLFESYCEMWAEIMNVLFLVYPLESDTPARIKKAGELLERERAFSLFQNAKILRYFGIDYDDLHNPKSHDIRQRKYKEETHVLSYFIIRSIFFFFLDEYVSWCVTHNGLSLQFDCSEKTIESYCNLVGKYYKSPVYTDTICDFEEWFSALPSKEFSKFELRTLRMTLYG